MTKLSDSKICSELGIRPGYEQKWHLMFAWAPRKIECRTTSKLSWAWLKTIGKQNVSLQWGMAAIIDKNWDVRYFSKEDALIEMLSGPKE